MYITMQKIITNPLGHSYAVYYNVSSTTLFMVFSVMYIIVKGLN